MMQSRPLVVSSVTVRLLIVAGSLFAHHSDAVFNHERLLTITGIVTRFEFVNPHQQIYLNVQDDKGNVVEWIVTDGPPRAMRRWGWTSTTVKQGEQLTVSGFAYKDGRPIMINVKLLRASGEELRTTDTSQRFYREFMEKYGGDPTRFSEIGKKKR